MTAPTERIQTLDAIEKDVVTCLQSAGDTFKELSKEKSSLKQIESHTHQFLKTLSSVEGRLTEQINYLTQVSTGQSHEGSGYASQKVLQMAWHRLEHARTRLNELERTKNKYQQDTTLKQSQLQQQSSMTIQSQQPSQTQHIIPATLGQSQQQSSVQSVPQSTQPSISQPQQPITSQSYHNYP